MATMTRGLGLLIMASILASGCTRDEPERDVPLPPLREAFDAPPDGVATAATRQANARVAEGIATLATADIERARRGLIARHARDAIRAADGTVVWQFPELKQYEANAPDTVNPSLWRQAVLNYAAKGLYEVIPGKIYLLTRRCFDRAGVQANATHRSPLFVEIIVQRIAAIGKGQPFGHQQSPNVLPVDKALGNDPPVTVAVAWFAAGVLALEHFAHGAGDPKSAIPSLAIGGHTSLILFGCVDAKEPDTGFAHVKGVAVNHAQLA